MVVYLLWSCRFEDPHHPHLVDIYWTKADAVQALKEAEKTETDKVDADGFWKSRVFEVRPHPVR